MTATITEPIVVNEELPDSVTSETPTGTLHVMDSTGDTRHTWDSTKELEVKIARKIYNKLTKRASEGGAGYLAYTVKGDGSKGEVIREFDPTAEAIILAPQTVGG